MFPHDIVWINDYYIHEFVLHAAGRDRERERKKEREEVMYINSTGEQQFIPPTKTIVA